MNGLKYYPHKTSMVTRSYYYPFFFYPNYYLRNVYEGEHKTVYDPDEYSKYESFNNLDRKNYYKKLFFVFIILSVIIILYINNGNSII